MNHEDIIRAGELARELLSLLEKEMPQSLESPPETLPPSPKITASRKMAKEAYDEMKQNGDPEFDNLPEPMIARMEEFARLVRNAMIETLSSAVSRAYSRFTESVVTEMQQLKE